MSHALLVTFLGRSPKGENGYRKTRYDFGDGTPEKETAFFGWVLRERLHPSHLVVLGTAGSMWDHLFEGDLDLGETGEQERVALMEAVEHHAVTQEQLDRMAPLLEKVLGIPTRLRIIPYCRTESEQVKLLRILADEVQSGERVHLDISHGFRHLPMLALLAALYIRQLKDADIRGIWYGSFDPDTGKAPVYELSGLLRIADWLQVLAGFDKDGDYRPFVPLLRQAGLDASACDQLEAAAYFENILNVGEATGKLRKARDRLCNTEDSCAPDASLLLPAICERLEWVAEPKQFEKQVELAKHTLSRRDYLRATLYAFEACITRLCQLRGVDINDFDAREHARRSYREWLKEKGSAEERGRYRLLQDLRNQVAHGTRGTRGEVQKLLLNEERFSEFLQDTIEAIANDWLPDPETVKSMPV